VSAIVSERTSADGWQWFSLRERPDLADSAFGVPYEDTGSFMQGSLTSALVRRTRLSSQWPDYVVAVTDPDGSVVARAVAVPYSAKVPYRDRLPDNGWDEVAVWAAEDALDGREIDAACALEIVVHPSLYGRGLSSVALHALRTQLGVLGFDRFLAPLRPPDKAHEPHVPMHEYARRRRADGLPEDRWLRVHERAGGTIVGIAATSATVQAPLETWRKWTGLPFDRSGDVVVPGALTPVHVSVEHDYAVYVEPNIWVEHRTAEPQTT